MLSELAPPAPSARAAGAAAGPGAADPGVDAAAAPASCPITHGARRRGPPEQGRAALARLRAPVAPRLDAMPVLGSRECTAKARRARWPGATPIVTDAADSPLQFLYSALDFGTGDHIDSVQLSAGLRRLGARWPARAAAQHDQLRQQLIAPAPLSMSQRVCSLGLASTSFRAGGCASGGQGLAAGRVMRSASGRGTQPADRRGQEPETLRAARRVPPGGGRGGAPVRVHGHRPHGLAGEEPAGGEPDRLARAAGAPAPLGAGPRCSATPQGRAQLPSMQAGLRAARSTM